MRASLPMYDWQEERAAVDAFWTHLRVKSGLMLPEALERPGDEAGMFALWHDPRTVLSQCCWGPISLGMVPRIKVLAQPDYSDVPGGRGAAYRSALIARTGKSCAVPGDPGPALPAGLDTVGRLATNARHSMSGWLALMEDAKALRLRVYRNERAGTPHIALEIIETGGHRASIQAVAEGRADLAAVDCRSWALALRHEACTADLVVVGWTAERPGLPFVTSDRTEAETAARLRETLIGLGCHPPQARDR
jgi:ABC-type phosphate/phosphonate transport system substrate-binding protein